MTNTNLTADSYGEEIDIKEANGMITEFLELDKLTIKSMKEDVTPLQKNKLNVLNGKTYNAFIFTKDLIMRFFDGSEKDKFGNPKSSNFLMVILGAHPHKKNGFQEGSFTVLTAGCERIIEKNGDKKEVRFYPLDIPKAANEYPPRTVVSQLKPRIDGENEIYFVATE